MTFFDHKLHHTTDFPIVHFRNSLVVKGYASAWCEEMDVLVDAGIPFVLIYPPRRVEEDHEDRKMRGIWLKRNKDKLAGACRALISVEPDAVQRAQLEGIFENLQRAFGTPQAATASLDEAVALGRRLLAVDISGSAG
jgi:hypothetical protein